MPCRPGGGEGQWEVAGAEHRDRAERDPALPDIGARERFAVQPCRIDAGTLPGPGPQLRGEQAQLTAGTTDFAGEPRTGQRGLGVSALHQQVPTLVKQLGDAVEELRTPLGTGRPKSRKRLLCQRASPLNVFD